MTHGEQAKAYFYQGYNCAQSVFLAFLPEIGMKKEDAARLVSGMGGGVGRLREVCGAVSGMTLAFGYLKGYADPAAKEEKAEVYAEVQALAQAFRERFGSVVCRELLPAAQGGTSPVPAERNAAYYAERPCAEYVACAAQLLADHLGLNS